MEDSDDMLFDISGGSQGETSSRRMRKTKATFLEGLDNGYDSGSNLGSSSGTSKKKKKRGPKPKYEEQIRYEVDPYSNLPTLPVVKRPRGRPPLSAKKLPPYPPLGNSLLPPHSISIPIPSSYKPISIAPSLYEGDSAPTKETKESSAPAKYPRPAFQSVVSKVVAKLMTSDPISLNDLSRRLVECPRDMVHAVLEVLQVLGLVTQFKAKEGLKPEYQSGTVVYTFLDFAKVPHAIGLDEIEKDIAEQLEKQQNTQRRLELIQVSFICR